MKPSFCASCTQERDDLVGEEIEGKVRWTCTDCREAHPRSGMYGFDKGPINVRNRRIRGVGVGSRKTQ